MEHHVNFSSVPLGVSFVDKILKNCRKLQLDPIFNIRRKRDQAFMVKSMITQYTDFLR